MASTPDAVTDLPIVPMPALGAPRWRWLWAAGLCLLVVLAYGQTIQSPFVFDSPRYLEVFDGSDGAIDLDALLDIDRRPLVNLSFAINHAFARGADGVLNPLGFRVFNVLVHLACGLVLMGAVRRTCRLPGLKPRLGPRADAFGFVVAAVWLVHPLNTEAVNYMVQRSESMAALAIFLCLYASIRHWQAVTRPRKRLWLWTASLAAIAGVMCEPDVAFVPLLIFLYDTTFLRNTWPQLWRKRVWLYTMLAVAWIPVIWLSQVSPPDLPRHPPNTSFAANAELLPPLTYWATQFGVVLHYLRLSFWPDPLVLDYGWLNALPGSLEGKAWWTALLRHVLPQGIAVMAIFAASLFGVLHRRWWGYLGMVFFLLLAPTSLLPRAGVAEEHRMYVPLLAMICLAVFGAALVLNTRRVERFARPTAWTLATLVILAGLFGTRARNAQYANPVELWEQTLEAAPHNERAGYYLERAKLSGD